MNEIIFPDVTSLNAVKETVKKGTLLLKDGYNSDSFFYVEKGCLRSYVIDKKGKEHIIQFAPENWFISDLSIFDDNHRAIYNIDAVEDSVIRIFRRPGSKGMSTLEKAALANLLDKFQKRISVLQKRIIQLLSATAEERYKDFNATYPNLAQRLPQYMIASYLGITAESLSRVRKEMYSKK